MTKDEENDLMDKGEVLERIIKAAEHASGFTREMRIHLNVMPWGVKVVVQSHGNAVNTTVNWGALTRDQNNALIRAIDNNVLVIRDAIARRNKAEPVRKAA